MSGNRFRSLNQWYYAGHQESNADNNAADEIIASPDKYLLTQEQLFNANGGWNTVAMSLGLTAFGTILVFGGSRRLSTHWRQGQCHFYDWSCLLSSGLFWYIGGMYAGKHTFGDVQAVQNHWMAYTFVKA